MPGGSDDENGPEVVDISMVVDRVRAISTRREFLRAFPTLDRDVKALTFIATNDPTLRDSIVAMKQRITKSTANDGNTSTMTKDLMTALAERDTDLAAERAALLTESYYAAADREWSKQINVLISRCDTALLAGGFNLSGTQNAIQGSRARRQQGPGPIARALARLGALLAEGLQRLVRILRGPALYVFRLGQTAVGPLRYVASIVVDACAPPLAAVRDAIMTAIQAVYRAIKIAVSEVFALIGRGGRMLYAGLEVIALHVSQAIRITGRFAVDLATPIVRILRDVLSSIGSAIASAARLVWSALRPPLAWIGNGLLTGLRHAAATTQRCTQPLIAAMTGRIAAAWRWLHHPSPPVRGPSFLWVLAGPPVVQGIGGDVVNRVADCPLNVFRSADLVDRVLACVRGTVEPLGNWERVVAVVPLDATEAACTEATALLGKAFTGGLALGNTDLWFAVVWRLAEQGRLAGIDAATTEHIRRQMRFRCEHHHTSIALSGLPELPTAKAPLGVAAWYVFAASSMSACLPAQEPLRAHLSHTEELLALVDLCGHALPAGTREHVTRLQVLASMLSWVKSNRHTLQLTIRALTQATAAVAMGELSPAVVEREGIVLPLVPIDGPATEAMIAQARLLIPPLWASVPPEELAVLAARVDPSKSLGDIALPFDISGDVQCNDEAYQPVRQWAHTAATLVVPVPICPATCRPYYVTPEGTWQASVAARSHIRPEDDIPVHNYFGMFVRRYRAYPTRADLLVFCFNRIAARKSGGGGAAAAIVTLPVIIAPSVATVCSDYALIVADVAPLEFIKRWRASASVESRQRMERH